MTATTERTVVHITLPMLPPTVNHLYIAIGRHGKALSSEAQAFYKYVLATVLEGGRPAVPSDARLALTVRLTFPDRKRTDLDNRLKAAQDSIARALQIDDCRIDRVTAERIGVVRNQPRCEMVLEVLQ